MDQDEHRPFSSGRKPQQKPRIVTIHPDAPANETASPGTRSEAPRFGIREAGDGSSSSSPNRGIPASPGRARRRDEASASRVSARLAEVRRDLFGDEGIPAIAEALRLPHQTWMNFEKGVVMPATTLLCFLDLTSVDPHWLLTGRGPKYQAPKGRFPSSTRDDKSHPDGSSRNDAP